MKETKDCNNEDDIIWNPYRLYNAVLVGKLTEMEEINNELKATINKLSIENDDLREKVNLKDKDVAAKDNYL